MNISRLIFLDSGLGRSPQQSHETCGGRQSSANGNLQFKGNKPPVPDHLLPAHLQPTILGDMTPGIFPVPPAATQQDQMGKEVKIYWKKLSVVDHAYSLSTWQVEAGESRIQGYPWLHVKLKASLCCMRPCLKGKLCGKNRTDLAWQSRPVIAVFRRQRPVIAVFRRTTKVQDQPRLHTDPVSKTLPLPPPPKKEQSSSCASCLVLNHNVKLGHFMWTLH